MNQLSRLIKIARVLSLSLLFLCPVLASAAVIVTQDGRRLEGKISRVEGGWQVTQADGTQVTVDSENVASMEAGTSLDSPSVAADRLGSLRRVSEHLTDIDDIISRYEKFVVQIADPMVRADAQRDLDLWRQRKDQGLVKLGTDWMTPQEREQRRQSADAEALPAADLISNYRYQEADKILRQAVLDDPQSATALYLQGVSLYKQEQVSMARKCFEAVLQIIPNHAPTLNNLAVISWRQKSFVASMNFYAQAMMASPIAKPILDNVAEALNALPPENRQAPVVRQAANLFAEQDTELQKAAAQQGLYRWGSGWVTAQQLADLKAAEARVQQQIDALQSRYDQLQAKVDDIDSEIGKNNREMARLEAVSIGTNENGVTVTLPPPPVYYELQADNQKLKTDKDGIVQQQQDLKNQAREVQKGLPTPKFTGVQQILGVEAMPVRNAPTTQPADFAASPAGSTSQQPATSQPILNNPQ
jgi:tetratricopeptide (TPR) repeat protein